MSGIEDPLLFLQRKVFRDSEHFYRIADLRDGLRSDFLWHVIRYCEVSAWAEEPPLIIALLKSFNPPYDYDPDILTILKAGPYRCHPPKYPFYVCRVAAELPLLGRKLTRAAALGFGQSVKESKPGQNVLVMRVLRVFGPPFSGKSYTVRLFEYLSAIKPLDLGVLRIDFGDQEMLTQAASANIPLELFIARRLEAQVRRRREELRSKAKVPQIAGLPPLALPVAEEEFPFLFSELTDQQQRNRWAGELATEFVDQVLYRSNPVPKAWVVVFDNCEKCPAEAQEFIRQLVARAAGTDQRTAAEADAGPLRIVLLGNSDSLLPNPIHQKHVVVDDLTGQKLDVPEVKEYFKVFCLCRGILLDDSKLDLLAADAVRCARDVQQASLQPGADWQSPVKEVIHAMPSSPSSVWQSYAASLTSESRRPEWPEILALAVLEKSLPLEALTK
jgi:hypothetical protein